MAFLDEVNHLTQRNYWQTCLDLLNASPYLSDTVLATFMFNPLRRPIAKTLVLLANSPLPMALRFRIDKTNLGYWFKWYLKQFQNGTNPREAKEMEISDLKTENSRLLYRILAYGNFMADSLPAYHDSVMTVLDNEQGFDKGRFSIPLLIQQGRYDGATTAINDWETYAATLPDNPRNNLLDHCEYLNIAKQYVQSGYDAGIVKQYRQVLEQWANRKNSLVEIPAQILLEQTYPKQFDYPEKIELPEHNRGKALFVNPYQKPVPDIKNEDDMLTVYPNPAKDKLLIEYVNINGGKEQTVSIYDMQGHQLKSQKVKDVLGIITFDVSDLSNGTYVIKAGEFSKQIIIAH